MRFDLIRRAMAEKRMTYADVALQTGLAIPHVRRVILGQHPHVSARVLASICRVVGVSLTDVLSDELHVRERKTG